VTVAPFDATRNSASPPALGWSSPSAVPRLARGVPKVHSLALDVRTMMIWSPAEAVRENTQGSGAGGGLQLGTATPFLNTSNWPVTDVSSDASMRNVITYGLEGVDGGASISTFQPRNTHAVGGVAP
jgi:hypothetical protein